MIKLHKKITREKKSAFLTKQASAGKTLDIGCGDKYYGKFFPNLISADVDPERKPDVVASVYQLPFKDGEFDNVLCTEVLEHLAEPTAAILEMERVLKPGGKLILTTCFIFPIHDAPGDYFRYTKYGLAELFKNWQRVEIQTEVGSLATIGVLLQRMIFQAKFKANKIIKALLLILANLFLWLDKLTVKEFGNIEQNKIEKNILTSSYYLVAYKK